MLPVGSTSPGDLSKTAPTEEIGIAFAPNTGPDGAVDRTTGSVGSLRWFVFALFFIFGGIASLNDIIIFKLREIFTLTHASSMLVQSAFFIAYASFSIPAAAIVRRFGYAAAAAAKAAE